jgi:hypothetical protein
MNTTIWMASLSMTALKRVPSNDRSENRAMAECLLAHIRG